MLTDPPPGPGEKPRRKWPWYRPVVRNWRRHYLRQFPRKKKLHGTFLHRLLGNRLFDPGLWLPTRDTVAVGVAIGTFIGMMPFFGLQIALSIALCFVLRVNVTAAVVATFISNPLTGGGILYLQYRIGKWLSSPPTPEELENLTGVLRLWVINGKPTMIGAVVTGVAGALIAYPLTLLLWSGVTKAAGKAIAVRQAKKAAHGHEAQGADRREGAPPPEAHRTGPGGGPNLAGGLFPEGPEASAEAEKD
jgi:uncharacterized protein